MVVVTEEDRVNHQRTTLRNGQASRCRHCCTLRTTKFDEEPLITALKSHDLRFDGDVTHENSCRNENEAEPKTGTREDILVLKKEKRIYV